VVDALMAALRTHRDRAMVLGGLRRCEVLGLRLEDLRVAEQRVFIAEGKGGRQRLIPVSGWFFAAVAAYLDAERPPGAGTDRVFVVLKGPRRGQPLSATGIEEILSAARRRAGLDHATCHERRPTCLTQLGSRDGAGGGAGPGRVRLDRVDPDLPELSGIASAERETAGQQVTAGSG
jgi:integrase/recombinase XerD